MAAAGVDASNAPEGVVLLLPEDPDARALQIATALREATGKTVAVILTDTLGRPWREGQTDAAIGAAGLRVVDDLRGLDRRIRSPARGDDRGRRRRDRGRRRPGEGQGERDAGGRDPRARAPGRRPRSARRAGADPAGGPGHVPARVSDEAWREGYEAGLRAAGPRKHESCLPQPFVSRCCFRRSARAQHGFPRGPTRDSSFDFQETLSLWRSSILALAFGLGVATGERRRSTIATAGWDRREHRHRGHGDACRGNRYVTTRACRSCRGASLEALRAQAARRARADQAVPSACETCARRRACNRTPTAPTPSEPHAPAPRI